MTDLFRALMATVASAGLLILVMSVFEPEDFGRYGSFALFMGATFLAAWLSQKLRRS